jgi:mycofactocin system glycosyltransferase
VGGLSGPVGAGLPLPGDFGVVLDARTTRPGPGLLVGGTPWRLVRLSPAGDRQVDRWAAGAAVGRRAGAVSLARRLFDAGLAHPVPRPRVPTGTTVSVVIPVRDRPAGLAATLDALGGHPAVTEVVVVDDASLDPAATVATVAATAQGMIRVVRRATRGGPAGARNTGWRAATGDVVAFLDADCVPAPGWLDPLLGQLRDPTVTAVAPRVVALIPPGTPNWLARYEARRSPLDLGGRPAPVRPGSAAPYVPTAALLVRRCALVDLGGFDEAMAVGEDVDLIWRLSAAGERIRYEPRSQVAHPVRPGLRPWLGQRYAYGTSATPLADRHGAAVSPLQMSPWRAVAWVAGVAFSPLAGVAALAASTAVLVVRRRAEVPAGVLLRSSLSSHLRTARATAEATRKVWWPLVGLAAVRSPRARRVALAAVLPLVAEWMLGRPRPPLGPLRWVGLRTVDDAAYGAGVWSGVLRSRRAGALLPRRPQLARAAHRTKRTRTPGPAWPAASRSPSATTPATG